MPTTKRKSKGKGKGKTARSKATKTPKAASKRRSANVPESQRHTERVILRLDPEVAARLRAIAAAWHVTLAEVVTDALDALKRAAPPRRR
jgi:hypothetical protein